MGSADMGAIDTTEIEQPTAIRLVRRIALPMVVGVALFAALWYALLTALMAACVASVATIVLVAGPGAASPAEGLSDTLARAILGILAASGAFLAAILSIVN